MCRREDRVCAALAGAADICGAMRWTASGVLVALTHDGAI